MTIGLVLEGGGMRGLYTAGVLDVMMQHQLHADVICGTSAGVTFGLNLPSNQPGRVLRYNLANLGRRDYISFYSWLTTGNMINVPFAYDVLPRVADPFDNETFMRSGTKFLATATNMDTGRAEYLPVEDCFRDMGAVQASASLPFLSRPVHYHGQRYLDGGIVDNIPIRRCLEEKCDKVIVVLTRPKGYVKRENLVPLSRLFYPCNKALHQAFAMRDDNYMESLRLVEQLEKEGRIMVVRPSRAVKIGRLEKNPDRLREQHQLGLDDMQAEWGRLQQYLMCNL